MKLLRQYLYLLNILLVCELLLAFFLIMLIRKAAVVKKDQPVVAVATTEVFSIPELSKPPTAQIFGKRDVFGLGQGADAVEQAKVVPSTALPQLIIPEIPKAPPTPTVDFIDPLPISVNGIIGSSDIDRTICIIADETDKEETYRVGDRIKDGSIIKILRDRVVILRLNGQVETFFLHEVSGPSPVFEAASAVTKLNDNKYRINLVKFKKNVVNLGGLLDLFEVVPFSGKDGKMIGVVVVDTDPNGLPAKLGFLENDLILSVGGVGLMSNKDRMAAYDQVLEKGENSELLVDFERNGVRMQNTYLLQTTIPKVGNIPDEIFSVDSSKGDKQDDEKPEFVGLVTQGQKKQPSLFPELMSPAERAKSESLYKDNIKRIREDMFARMKKRNG